LGAGKMGGILLRAFLDQQLVSIKDARATVRHADRAEALAHQLGICVSTDNRAAARDADVILVAVKPVQVGEVLDQIRSEITPRTLIVSTAASVPIRFIEQHLPDGVPVVRAMPNTPCAIGCGMTGLSSGSHASAAHLNL